MCFPIIDGLSSPVEIIKDVFSLLFTVKFGTFIFLSPVLSCPDRQQCHRTVYKMNCDHVDISLEGLDHKGH